MLISTLVFRRLIQINFLTAVIEGHIRHLGQGAVVMTIGTPGTSQSCADLQACIYVADWEASGVLNLFKHFV